MNTTEAALPGGAALPVTAWPLECGWVGEALRELAAVRVSFADGYAGRVADAVLAEQTRAVAEASERALRVGRRGAEAVADWARRDRRTVGALASSALLVGALAIGLEARHVRRLRRRALPGLGEERAA